MEQLSFQALPVLTWLFESTIYISILICLIFIIKTLTKKKLPAWWSYSLWLLLLIRMLIPFGVETPVSVYNYVPALPENSFYMPYLIEHSIPIPFYDNAPDASPAALSADVDIADKSLIENHGTHKSAADISGFNLSFDRALLLIWFAGILAFGIAAIYKNCKFWLIVRREQPVIDKDILDLFAECKSTLGIQKSVEILVTGSVKSPAIFGYVKPQLLLPPQFLDTLNKDDLHCIFMHELGHVKRHDIGVSWLATLFQVIYWFNPLVWYAFHHLRADQEAACDAYVLSKIKKVRPTDYARTIVNLLERFVQNRQLPSLAGIIENKSQIDWRISMILDYKRITLKKTFVSVLMLFMMIGAFFACSTGRLADRESGMSDITLYENSDMKHYKNDDWNFSLDIPRDWTTLPSLHAYFADKEALINFGMNDSSNVLFIFLEPHNPELSLNEELDRIKKQLANDGFGNFVSKETTIGSRKALILDLDKKVEDDTLRAHAYLIPDRSIIYALGFVTTRSDPTFELYDRIAETFKLHEAPVARGIKKYVSPDGNLEMEIPANWNTMPDDISNDELVRFGTPENGVTAIINNPVYISGESLEDFRSWIQGIGEKYGYKDFTDSETVINGRRTLILDCGNGSSNSHAYFFEYGDYKYRVTFFTSPETGTSYDRVKVYEQVMRSVVIHKQPEAAGFKEYAGPDINKPIASGTKRYISPEGDYTVDVPGDWYPYTRDDAKYSAVSSGFATSKNGLTAIFYPQTYNPGQTLEERRDGQVKVNTDAGWKILRKSETVINGRKTLILDSSTGAINVRNYLFRKGDYIYSMLFYEFNTDDMPADRIKGYERIMASINILNDGLERDEFTDSDTAEAGVLPVQFRFGENEPGRDLEETTVSGSDRKVYLHKESVLSNADIMTAAAQSTETGFGVSVTFTEAGRKKFADISKDNVGKILGVVVDGKLIMAPVIRVPITGGNAFITGNFTREEAIRIARGIVGKK